MTFLGHDEYFCSLSCVRHLKINQNRAKCLTLNWLELQILWAWWEMPARHSFVWSWGVFRHPTGNVTIMSITYKAGSLILTVPDDSDRYASTTTTTTIHPPSSWCQYPMKLDVEAVALILKSFWCWMCPRVILHVHYPRGVCVYCHVLGPYDLWPRTCNLDHDIIFPPAASKVFGL